jgi:biopolymer transport protein ExbD
VAHGRHGHAIISGINVTPLVDIMLVLLVIFIVTARILVTPAVPVDLPTASEAREVQVVFSVVVPTSGGLFVNGAPVASDEAFLERAREAHGEDADLRAVIHADASVPHGRVIEILDLLRRAGVARIAFAALAMENGE